MACKEKLADWLFKNREPLNLTVFKAQWVKEWLPQFHDLRVQIDLDGRMYEGRGMDMDTDLAFTKAGAEAMERAIVHKSQERNTSGIALHTDELKAKKNAFYELLERDQFLCHFLTKTPFVELESLGGFQIDFQRIKDKLEKENIEITLKRTLFSEPKTVICLARKLSNVGFKGVIGLGTSDTWLESALKAITECLTNVVFYIENENPQDHHKLYLSSSAKCDLDWIFSLSTSKSNSIKWEGKVTFKK